MNLKSDNKGHKSRQFLWSLAHLLRDKGGRNKGSAA